MLCGRAFDGDYEVTGTFPEIESQSHPAVLIQARTRPPVEFVPDGFDWVSDVSQVPAARMGNSTVTSNPVDGGWELNDHNSGGQHRYFTIAVSVADEFTVQVDMQATRNFRGQGVHSSGGVATHRGRGELLACAGPFGRDHRRQRHVQHPPVRLRVRSRSGEDLQGRSNCHALPRRGTGFRSDTRSRRREPDQVRVPFRRRDWPSVDGQSSHFPAGSRDDGDDPALTSSLTPPPARYPPCPVRLWCRNRSDTEG